MQPSAVTDECVGSRLLYPSGASVYAPQGSRPKPRYHRCKVTPDNDQVSPLRRAHTSSIPVGSCLWQVKRTPRIFCLPVHEMCRQQLEILKTILARCYHPAWTAVNVAAGEQETSVLENRTNDGGKRSCSTKNKKRPVLMIAGKHPKFTVRNQVRRTKPFYSIQR